MTHKLTTIFNQIDDPRRDVTKHHNLKGENHVKFLIAILVQKISINTCMISATSFLALCL